MRSFGYHLLIIRVQKIFSTLWTREHER